ncbi:MAG: SpoIIE family protein phosphatase [Verrucomicrobiota bacterium]
MKSDLQTRYQALLLAARNLFALTNLDDLLDNILRHSRQMMNAEACSLYLPDAETRELIIYSARGQEDRDFHTVRIPWDKGIAGTVFTTREMIRIDDAQNDDRVFKPVAGKGGFVNRAMVTIPLLDGEQALGVLQAINPVDGGIFDEHDVEIFEGLASLVTSALLRLEAQKAAVEEAKFQQELELAHEIQQSFLPPSSVMTDHAEVRVQYQPARTVGGDFYASVELPGDRLLVAAGDVSGKGIPAALTTAQVTGEMNALSGYATGDLTEFVRKLNTSLCGKLAAGRFVATTFLLYDPHARTMETICAGQFSPWCLAQDGDWEEKQVPRSLPLGVFENFEYEATTFSCQPGEKWLMFSDGINEGRNNAEEEYGFERLQASLQPGSPAQVLEGAWLEWIRFVNTSDLHDDACLVLLTTHPPRSFEMLSDPGNCKSGRDFIEHWACAAGYSDLDRGQIVLAADEAFTNIIRHAYKNQKDQKIVISIDLEADAFRLSFRDFGPPLDVNCLKGRKLEDVKPGGLGLHLLEMIFERVEYICCEPGTELVLRKKLPLSTSAPLTPAGVK